MATYNLTNLRDEIRVIIVGGGTREQVNKAILKYRLGTDERQEIIQFAHDAWEEHQDPTFEPGDELTPDEMKKLNKATDESIFRDVSSPPRQ